MNKTGQELWVVMPIYNEEESIRRVLDEWLPMLRETIGNDKFVLAAINDGSKDRSLDILQDYARRYSELIIIDKTNSGHGQSCIYGYRIALENGVSWIFQMDSDGQCDPRFFPRFWELREKYPVIYGYRKKRDDGFGRYLMSRVVSLVTFLGAGVWVRDPNVPYRLMRAESLSPFIEGFPKDFHLANILLAALQKKCFKIYWVDIHFRQRFGGVMSVKHFSFLKQGYKLLIQMLRAKKIIETLTVDIK